MLGDADKPTTLEHFKELKFTLRCISESMRLYPHPPVLLRRALMDDELPGGYSVPAGQDVMISVYNVHRSPQVWDQPDDFVPERFPVDEPPPTERNTNFRCEPCCTFGSVPRPCVARLYKLVWLAAGAGSCAWCWLTVLCGTL